MDMSERLPEYGSDAISRLSTEDLEELAVRVEREGWLRNVNDGGSGPTLERAAEIARALNLPYWDAQDRETAPETPSGAALAPATWRRARGQSRSDLDWSHGIQSRTNAMEAATTEEQRATLRVIIDRGAGRYVDVESVPEESGAVIVRIQRVTPHDDVYVVATTGAYAHAVVSA